MSALLVLFIPALFAAGLFYLFSVMCEALLTAAGEYIYGR